MSLPAWEDSDEPVSERPATKMLNHSHISGISLNNTGIPSRSGIDTFESLSNGNRVHRAPLATASTPMHNMAPQASLSRGNGENMTNNISGVLHQKPIYTAKQEQQEFDELSCRQWMSNISDRIDILRRGISDIHNHIMNTSDIDKKAINTIFPVTEHQSYNQVKLNNINRGNRNNYGGVIDMAQTLYAQETNAVESSIIDLQACLSDVLFCFSDCFDSRKTSYVAQLKKMRDVANNATRNAIQTCKMDTTNSLNQLKHSLERKKEMEFTDINKRLRESESSNGKIVLQMGEIKMQLEQAQANEREYLYKMQQLTDAHQKSSEEKLKEHVSNLNNEALKYEEKLAKEKQRMKAEYAEQLKTLSDQHNLQLMHQEKHFDEVKFLLNSENNKLIKEIDQLKDVVKKLNRKLESEHENYESNLNEEKAKYDNQIKLLQADNIKSVTLLRSELALKIQKMKVDEQIRIEESEALLLKDREKVCSKHLMELEIQDENHKKELKRLQAHLETRQKEELVKIKHIHEMELSRCIRENERLTKLLARAAGGIGEPSSPVVSAPISYKPTYSPTKQQIENQSKHLIMQQSAIRRNESNPSASRNQRAPYEEPPPPPPVLQEKAPVLISTKNSSSNPSRTNFLKPTVRNDIKSASSGKWGNLTKSLSQEEVKFNINPKYNDTDVIKGPPPPPDDFEIEDAYAHSKLDSARGSSYVASNSDHVTGYMEKLQNYLEDFDDTIESNKIEVQAAKTNMEDRSSPDDINRKSKVKVNKHKLRTARLESEIEELLHDSDEYIAPFTAVPDDMKPDAPSSPNNTVSSKTVSVLPLDTTSQLLGESINTEVNSSATALPNEYAVPRVASDTNNSNSGISLSSDARKLLGTYDDDEVLLEMDSDSMDEAEDPRHHMEEHDDVDSQEMSDDEYFAKNLITELSLSN